MKPAFIVLEALDGVGKTTLAEALAARLGGVAMNTPGDALRVASSTILDGLGEDQDARCLFYASSVVARGREAEALVRDGATVVMDRYWLSTISYARARGVRAALRQVEALVPVPDITVLLTLDEQERQRRMHERGYTLADRETLNPRFRDTVLQEMMRTDRPSRMRPVAVDVTGAGVDVCLDRVMAALCRIENAW